MKFYNFDLPGLCGNGPVGAEAARTMSSLWTGFARTGVPAAHRRPVWPRYQTQIRPVMLIDRQCSVALDPDGAERAMWQANRGWGGPVVNACGMLQPQESGAATAGSRLCIGTGLSMTCRGLGT